MQSNLNLRIDLIDITPSPYSPLWVYLSRDNGHEIPFVEILFYKGHFIIMDSCVWFHIFLCCSLCSEIPWFSCWLRYCHLRDFPQPSILLLLPSPSNLDRFSPPPPPLYPSHNEQLQWCLGLPSSLPARLPASCTHATALHAGILLRLPVCSEKTLSENKPHNPRNTVARRS